MKIATGPVKLTQLGYGLLMDNKFKDGVYISPSQIRLHEIKNGDLVTVDVRPPTATETLFAASKITDLRRFSSSLS